MNIISATGKIIVLAIASFILIHVLSIFGVFIAIAYPIWWAIAPQYIPTLIKRTPEQHGIKLAIINTLFILLVSAISLFLVYLENHLFFNLSSPVKSRTASFSIPSQGQYKIGEIFPMEIRIDSKGTSINAVQADLRFDPTIVKVVDVSTKDSFATVFVNKEIENDVGFTRISGGVPSAQALTQNGLFATVYFKGIMAGVVKIDFLPSSMVLANDGKGTNILKNLASASYLILPEELPKDIQTKQEADIISESKKADEDKIVFFEQKNLAIETNTDSGTVLGAKTNDYNILDHLVKLLRTVDEAIINFWKYLFGKI